MNRIIYSLALNGRTYTAEEQKNAAQWHEVLQAHHHKTYAVCLCCNTGDRKLAIKLSPGQKQKHFLLARFPDSGEEHAADCRFHEAEPDKSGLSVYESGVVKDAGDGTVAIRLKKPAKKRAPEDPPIELQTGHAPDLNRAGVKRQPTMSILGLGHLLFDRAGINLWRRAFEGKRSAHQVAWHLRQAAESVVLGGIRIGQLLVVPGQADRNRQIVQALSTSKQSVRLLAIAQLGRFAPDFRQKKKLPLRDSDRTGIPNLWMTSEQWSEVERRFPRAMAAWRRDDAVAVVLQARRPEPWPRRSPATFGAAVTEIAIFQVTPEWIPVESSYEAQVAERLVASGRAFKKPLRFDAGQDVVFPDFILHDAQGGPQTPMEVFGRDDESYASRVAEKVAYYQTRFGTTRWWSWNAIENPDVMPQFPPLNRAWRR